MPNVSDFRISVIIPCYKHAQFLSEAVESIIAQTHPVHEIIVVNDGSPDQTRAVISCLVRNNPRYRISCVDKPNGGLSDARNAGIERAEGEWILPLDADDRFESTFVEKAVHGLRARPKRNLAFTNLIKFGSDAGQWRPDDYSLETVAAYNVFPYSSIFPKELWRRVGGYDRALPWAGEDYSFWIACAQVGLSPVRIDEPLFHYRTHPGGGMYLELLKRWPIVEAMIRTTHSSLYSGPTLLAAHETIATMGEDTLEKLQDKITRFDDLAYPYLWRGISFESRGQFELALSDYTTFQSLHYKPDWQPVWRSLLCNVALNRWEGIKENREELTSFSPHHPWISDALRGFDQQQSVLEATG